MGLESVLNVDGVPCCTASLRRCIVLPWSVWRSQRNVARFSGRAILHRHEQCRCKMLHISSQVLSAVDTTRTDYSRVARSGKIYPNNAHHSDHTPHYDRPNSFRVGKTGGRIRLWHSSRLFRVATSERNNRRNRDGCDHPERVLSGNNNKTGKD